MSKETGLIYLNIYLVNRNYGGAEEGGWWYDCGECLASTPFKSSDDITEEVINLYLNMFKDIYYDKDKNHIDRFSMIGGDDVEAYIEESKGENFPKYRPRYE